MAKVSMILFVRRAVGEFFPHNSFWSLPSSFFSVSSSHPISGKRVVYMYTMGILTSGYTLWDNDLRFMKDYFFSLFWYKRRKSPKIFSSVCNISYKPAYWAGRSSCFWLINPPSPWSQVWNQQSSLLENEENCVGTTSISLKIHFWFISNSHVYITGLEEKFQISIMGSVDLWAVFPRMYHIIKALTFTYSHK